jgi:hypothetical protein
MNNTLQIAALFLAELGLGSAMVFPLIPVRVTGKSFIRFYYGLILVFIAAFLFCLYRLDQFHHNYLLATALGVWIWALSFTTVFTRLEEYLIFVFAAFSCLLFVIYAQKFFFHGLDWIETLPRLIMLLSAAVFLSFHLMNMVFGHWYLINRSLPITHLIKTSRALLIITYVRLATVAFGTYFAYANMGPDQFNRLIDFMGHGIFFWARILAGLGIPLLVAHLTYASAKIGSNQSATGIMYAGDIFVLMGEFMALYLYSITGYLF